MDMPMLEQHEAVYVLSGGNDPDRILRRHRELTGFAETNPNAVWHHVVGMYGAPCSSCGKPLRTPRARMCAACGAQVARGSPLAAPIVLHQLGFVSRPELPLQLEATAHPALAASLWSGHADYVSRTSAQANKQKRKRIAH
jgi:hypothetical protein